MIQKKNIQISAIKIICLSFMLAICLPETHAQLSDLHYLPPLRQSTNNVADNQPIKQQRLYLSTPESGAFSVHIYRGTSTTPLTTITSLSSSSPQFYNLPNANNNITIIAKERAGRVLTDAGLRLESANGEKFFVNYRANSLNQGTSLTSKGRSALGTSFKWGGLPLNRSQPSNNVVNGNFNINATLGIMATENNTVVDLFGYDPSINFRSSTGSNNGNNATGLQDDTYQINLQAGESFVFEVVKEGSALQNTFIDGFLGASVVSNKPIAVSYGSMNMSIVNDPNAGGWDVGIDQAIPESKIGREYVLIRGNGNNNEEQVTIIGTENNTTIFLNGDTSTPITLDNGDYKIVGPTASNGTASNGLSGTNYSSTSIGGSMFIQADKPIYVNQILCGKLNNGKATGELSFISPVNCLMVTEINSIPYIKTLAANGPSGVSGGVTIVATSDIEDDQITVSSSVSGASNNYTFNTVPGTDLWKTTFISNLSGHVSVSAPGPVAMSYILTGGNVGAAGYFSGFDNVPEIEITDLGDGCLPSSTLTATAGYNTYSWRNNGDLIPGQTSNTYTPSVPGNYSVQVELASCSYESAPVILVDCNPDIQITTQANVSSGQPGDEIIFTVKVKYIGEGLLTNLLVNNTIPLGHTYQSFSATFGDFNETSKVWDLGTMYSGEEHILTVTTVVDNISSSDQVSYVVSHTQDQTDGNTLADDLTETVSINPANLNTPSITNFGDINKFFLDGTFTLMSPNSDSGGVFTYTSSNTSVATISSSTVTIVAPGTSIITAAQSADPDNSYGEGNITAKLTVNENNQAVMTKFGKLTTSSTSTVSPTGKLASQMGITSTGKIVEVRAPLNTDTSLKLWLDSEYISSYNRLDSNWYDLSGDFNNGQLINNFNYSTTDANSFIFNGSNTYVDVLKANSASDDLTIETWIKPSVFSSGSIQTLFAHTIEGEGSTRLEFENNKLRANLSNASCFYDCPMTFTADQWYHISVVYSKTGNAIQFYVNGALIHTATVSNGPTILSSTFKLGSFNGATNYFNGKMGSFKMYTSARTAAEIVANFSSDKKRYGTLETTTASTSTSNITCPDGLTAATAATSASQLKADYPNYPDGAYYYQIPGSTDTVQLYTDMTRDGGGWIVISKWGGHSKTIDKIYNALDRELNFLQTSNFETYTTYARLSRDKMNAIWLTSKYVCRIHFRNTASTASSGVYFQNKLTNVSTFDLWKGHYSPKYWSDFNVNGNKTTGGGTYYGVSFANAITDPILANYSGNSSAFDPITNQIIGGTARNANMGWWDSTTINAPNLGNFEAGRHMGFFGDINLGNQWIFTSNPSHNNWSTSENRQTVVFLRW
jgi:uncharacterized repeat protein (TIGR01451 family)